MKTLYFVASHVGYPMDRTPLGGGAMVGLQLARDWARRGGFRLVVVGSGPEAPAAGVEYHRLPGGEHDLVHLSELGYARFCRRFEEATTRFLLERREHGPACVVVNDISESPDLERISVAGFPIVSIWHVDVVDYFNRMYLGGYVAPEKVVGAFETLRPIAGWAVPDVLNLVFDKQRRVVGHSARLVVPSRAMVGTIERCYRRHAGPLGPVEPRALVVPWGGWDSPAEAETLRRERERLSSELGLPSDALLLMTLSRLSPEKGVHLLLEALAILERDEPALPPLAVAVCGEAAFMKGRAYERRLRALASRLSRAKVFFPGYVHGARKQAFLERADLFLSPSVHDSYALTLVEALRAGVPVLASEHYGVREILADPASTDPSSGFAKTVSYEDGDPAERLAAALTPLLLDKPRLAAMRGRAAAAGRAMSFPEAAGRIAEACLEVAR